MRLVNFFKDLAKYLYKTENLNYEHILRILQIMLRNMNDKERAQYDYHFFRCLNSIHRQLDITDFTKGGKQDGKKIK